MRLRFRVTLFLILSTLIVLTVATVGISSFLNAQAAARELAGQILEQTALRVDQQVEKLLSEATSQCALTVQMLRSGQFEANDFPRLVHYWQGAMGVSPDLTSLFIGLEATGESVGLSRLRPDRPVIWQASRDPKTARLELREFFPEDFPDRPFRFDAGRADLDARPRPWYRAARRAGRATWTDAYVFLGVEGAPDVLGVTHALPFRRAGGDLEGVVMADFDLDDLCHFLKRLRVGNSGFAFLVESRSDGDRRVIAHPRPEILLTPGPARDLSPVEQLPDRRVGAFLARLPAPPAGEVFPSMGHMRFELDGKAFLGSYRRIDGELLPRWLICTVLPEAEVMAPAYASNRLTALISLAALGLAMATSVAVSRQVAKPLEQLAREAAAVGQLRLDSPTRAHSFVLEVDRLADASEEMKAGLRSFRKYVPADLVRRLLASGQEAVLGGERHTLTIYFSDIADFSTIAESRPGEELVAQLGEYLGALSEEILALEGTVDKFIGDAIMAFWGAPAPNPNQAAAACAAALRNQQRLRELQPAWRAAGRPEFRTRIGIHTGEAVVGNIGSPARMNYTVIGDAVNLASRLEGLNKYYGTQIIISEETYRRAEETVCARPLDWVAVKGRSASVLIYELLGLREDVGPDTAEFVERHARALDSYRNRRWEEALELLHEGLRQRPDDGPARVLIGRCRQYREAGPDEGWDGVHRLSGK